MRRTVAILLFGLLWFLGTAGSLQAAEELSNGGFESEPNFGAGTVGNDGGYSAFTGSQIPGWMIEPGHAVTIHNTNLYPFITGNYSANLDGEGFNGVNADFYQDFSSSSASSYAISYDYQGWYASSTTFTVSVTDLTTNSVLYSQTLPWTASLVHESANFTGTGDTLRLRVAEATTGFNDNAFIVDNFSVISTPIPEPAGIFLAAFALTALVAFSRRGRFLR